MTRKPLNRRGAVLIVVFVIMVAIFLLISYYLQFILTERKIAVSHSLATRTYYLTEAGIQEAIWKIRHDAGWLAEFQTNPSWEASIARSNPFGTGQAYTVTVTSVDLGNAEISVTGANSYGSGESQRIVKTNAFQAQGIPEVTSTTTAIFTDRDMNFSGTIINILGGSVFANDDINLSFFSEVGVDGTAWAVDRIVVPWGSSLVADALKSDNNPPAPEAEEMSQIDFNSDDPGSLLSRADGIYTFQEFKNLLDSSADIELNGIIYVQGNINFPRNVNLTVNGALVAEGNIKLGTEWWPFWESKPRLTVVDPGTGPAGLISMRQIHFASEAEEINIDGLIYAIDGIRADWLSPNINLNGGIIARDLDVNNFFNELSVTYDQEVIVRTLGLAADSPIINVEHWEEEY